MDSRNRFCPSLLPPPVTGPLERPTLPEDAVMFCPRLDFSARTAEPPDGQAEMSSDTSDQSDSPAQQPPLEELNGRFNW